MNAYAKNENRNLDMAINQTLPYDISFNTIEKFVKNFEVLVCTQGPKLPKIVIFLENGLYQRQTFLLFYFMVMNNRLQ